MNAIPQSPSTRIAIKYKYEANRRRDMRISTQARSKKLSRGFGPETLGADVPVLGRYFGGMLLFPLVGISNFGRTYIAVVGE